MSSDEENELRTWFNETRAAGDRDEKEMREHADAAIGLGEFLLREKRYDDAVKALRRARDIGDRESTFQPYHVDALLLIAEAELGRGQFARARAALEQARRPVSEIKASESTKEFAMRLATLTEKLASADRPSSNASKAPEERYRHPTLGEGVLVSRHDDKVKLRFKDGQERVFLADRLERLG